MFPQGPRVCPVIAAAVLAVLAGCVRSGLVAPETPAITPQLLLRGEPLTGPEADPPPVEAPDLLAIDGEMRAFLAAHVDSGASSTTRLQQLLEAMVGSRGLAIAYAERSHTALQAFRSRQGNCLSLTSLVVSLGREAGLDVRFQEVDIPPDWSRSGNSLVLNRHVDARVVHAGGVHVVDFNRVVQRDGYVRRIIGDERARAHYHSNLAVERLQEHDTVGALVHLRAALEHDSRFAPAWVNLGVLYQRAGHPRWAEAAWREALRRGDADGVALSNLERLYRQQGDISIADALQARIVRHRLRNPYYRHFLAEQAYAAALYEEAVTHLRHAVRARPGEDAFAALLGLSYLRLGERAAGQRWLARAWELSDDPAQRAGYQGKLERLRAP
jgi:tetratricopeptide (TPR) repeat protein